MTKKMKLSRIFSVPLIFIAASVALLLGCAPAADDDPAPSGVATADTITVAGKAVNLAAPHANWWEAPLGQVTIDPGFATGAVIAVTPTESGSTASYAKVAGINDDPTFAATSTFNIENNNYFYVKVQAAGGNVQYYFFQVKLVYSQVSLTKVTVGGQTAILENPALIATTADEGKVTLTPALATGILVVEVTKADAGQTLRFAKQAPGPDAPAFFAVDPSQVLAYTFTNGDYLYIEVTDNTGVFKYYYKIKVVIASDVATLTAPIKFGDPDAPDWTITTLSAAATTYNLTPNAIRTEARPTPLGAGIQVTATPTDSGATVKYAVSHTDPAAAPSFSTQSAFAFEYGSTWLDIQVTAANGVDERYYRFRINIGASVNTLQANSLTITQGATTITANPAGPNANPNGGTVVAVNTLTSALTGATVTATPTDPNATLEYAITKDVILMPVYGTANVFNFSLDNTWLYVRVTAQNGVFTNYRFKVSGSTDNTLQSGTPVSIGGVSASFGTPNAAYNSAAAVYVNLGFASAVTNVPVAATPTNPAAIVKYAVVAPGSVNGPDFTGAGIGPFAFGLGITNLYVQVTAQPSGDITYYRFDVGVGSNDKTITGVKLTRSGVTTTATSLGTPGAAANIQPTTDRGAIEIAALGNNTTVEVEGLSAGATVAWAVSNATTGAPTTYNNNALTLSATNTNVVIRVTAQNGSIQYYRIVATVR
jgi:hypothetical protein